MNKLISSIGVALIALSIFSGAKSNDFGNGTIPTPKKLLVIGDSLTNGLYATAEQNTFVSIVSRNTGMPTARRAAATLRDAVPLWVNLKAVSYTHLTLPTIHVECRSRWSPYH